MSDDRNLIAGYTVIPDDQKLTLALTPKNGTLMKARTLGAVIRNMGTILAACSDDPKDGVEVFITSLSMSEDGGVKIEFAVLQRIEGDE